MCARGVLGYYLLDKAAGPPYVECRAMDTGSVRSWDVTNCIGGLGVEVQEEQGNGLGKCQ